MYQDKYNYPSNEDNEQLTEFMQNDNMNCMSHIKFRRNKKKKRLKLFCKVIIFMGIAASSGALSGLYIVNSKYDKMMETNNGNFSHEQKYKSIGVYKNAVTKVVETVSPAVVKVNIHKNFDDNVNKSGSGIIFNSEGDIVTNYHLIKGADKITVKTAEGKISEAKIIGGDYVSDLAVIHINETNLPVANFGDSSNVKIGDLAIAIGNPLGEEFSSSVTAGIISGLYSEISSINNDSDENSIFNVIQTDAIINLGNSGGALCNEYGEVIGINSFKIKNNNENNNGIGFAISINEAENIIKSIMDYGVVSRAELGIYGGTAISKQNDCVEGVYVQQVIKKSSAEEAGIRPTDIIVEFDNKRITGMEELIEGVRKHKVGDEVYGKVWRKGKIININIKLSEMRNN